MILGIDAYNIRAGGGITHLYELLNAAEPEKHGFDKVIVWGGSKTLSKLAHRNWLELESHPYLDKSFFHRVYWTLFLRKKRLRKKRCDLLFVPGGTDFSSFRPMVTMSQNLLPFEPREMKRYGIGLKFLKFLMLRFTQSFTFRKADGVIFLTPYAEETAIKITGTLRGQTKIIPHGINSRFYREPSLRTYRSVQDFTIDKPCRLVYVSIVEIYKHQWEVIRAVKRLRDTGYQLTLDLAGPLGPGTPLLNQAIKELGSDNQWLVFHGAVPYEKIEELYIRADIGIFASSCETYGQIVSESMAASLPMICSELSAMKDVIKDNTIYFHPESPESIAKALEILINSAEKRALFAEKGYEKAKEMTWKSCAYSSFEFFRQVSKNVKK